MTTLSGFQHAEASRRRAVEHGSNRVLELSVLDDAVRLRDPDHLGEVTDALGREAAPAQAGDRRHARIVPAANVALLDEPEQEALGQHGVGDVQPGELVLPRPGGDRQVLDQPVVQRPVRLELERADRMGDALDRVRLAVREVVRRVDAPRVAGPRMRGVHDPVQHRVAQVDVGRGHVDLRAEHARAVGELAGPHPREEVEVLVDRAIAPRRVATGLGQRAAVLADLVGRQVVHVRVAVADQVDGPVVELLEVVRGVVEVLAPVEAEPADVALDRVDVLLLLLDRVRVVEAEVAAAAEVTGDAEVEADRLGMADVQVAVRLRREARDDRRMAPAADIRGNDLADEVGALGGSFDAQGRGNPADESWRSWLASKDSNLESPDPESGALPFGHSPATAEF